MHIWDENYVIYITDVVAVIFNRSHIQGSLKYVCISFISYANVIVSVRYWTCCSYHTRCKVSRFDNILLVEFNSTHVFVSKIHNGEPLSAFWCLAIDMLLKFVILWDALPFPFDGNRSEFWFNSRGLQTIEDFTLLYYHLCIEFIVYNKSTTVVNSKYSFRV